LSPDRARQQVEEEKKLLAEVEARSKIESEFTYPSEETITGNKPAEGEIEEHGSYWDPSLPTAEVTPDLVAKWCAPLTADRVSQVRSLEV